MTLPEPSADMNFHEVSALMCWFRRDAYDDKMTLARKGGYSDNRGWEIKLTAAATEDWDSLKIYMFGAAGATIYKTFRPIIDHKDHFFGLYFNHAGRWCGGIKYHEMELPDGTRCDAGENRMCPVRMMVDHHTERIWWKPQSADAAREILQSGKAIDDSLVGQRYELQMYHGADITFQDVIDYYEATKGNYAIS